jgi:hypothetical protein
MIMITKVPIDENEEAIREELIFIFCKIADKFYEIQLKFAD